MTALDNEAPRPLHATDNRQRLTALYSYSILDTPPEQGYDDIVLLASRLCETPVALVSLVADDRQWFKAKVGFEGSETPIAQSVCAHALQQPEMLIIPDLSVDPRTSGNTLVTDGPRIRFYAGAKLTTPEGIPLGSLCVIDTAPRPQGLTPNQQTALAALGRQVMAQMELRRSLAARDEALRALSESDARRRQILDSALDYAIITMDLDGTITGWNGGAEQILGWSDAEMVGKPSSVFFTPEDVEAAIPGREMLAARENGRGNDERWHLRKGGTRFWAQGELQPLTTADGRHIGYLKILRDRTEQRLASERRERDAAQRTFLLSLSDTLQRQGGPQERMQAAVEAVGRHLGVARVGYGFVEDKDTVTLDIEYLDGVPALRGTYPIDTFGPGNVRNLKAGRTSVYPDVEASPDTAGLGLADKGIRAILAVPQVHEGRLRSVLYINHHEPRDWPPDEVTLVEDVAARIWDAVERVRAQAKLKAVNASLEVQVAERALERGRTWTVSPDLLGVANADGYFESTNPAWQATLGWTFEELANTYLFDFLHPDDIARTEAAWTDAKNGIPSLSFENRWRCTDGSYRWLSWVAVPEAGKVYCSARDVTTGKAQAAELAARTAERDRLWRSSQDLLVAIDAAGRFVSVSPSVTNIVGWTPAELEGRSLFDFVMPEDVGAARDALTVATRDKLPVTENRYRHKDGGFRWLSWVAAPEGDLIFATGRHITAEKEAAAELATMQEALRQSQKMEAVGQLTGGIAHDFNNLLTGVTGSLELLQTRIAQGRLTEVERYINAAQGAAKRAAALTHRLLAFSRRQTLDPRSTDVNRLVVGMEDMIRRTVGPSIAVEVVAAGGLWNTQVDRGQLENALLNLCINGRDAMPEGGKLIIETANRWLDARAAKERDLPVGQYVSLCVSDNGTGMPPDVIARAFDPFFTTKPVGQGTGLGLSMIYGFARQSGGQVRIYSEVGDGTMLCLYLPRYAGGLEEAEHEHAVAEIPRVGQGETVLVVDDEPTVRMLVTEVLQDLGYTAIEAADGSAGLKVLQSDTRIDLLITDVGLPGGMNGRQVADAARALRPALQILFITGFAENAVLSHGHLDPGMHVMTKPFAMDVLASRIKELIAA